MENKTFINKRGEEKDIRFKDTENMVGDMVKGMKKHVPPPPLVKGKYKNGVLVKKLNTPS